MMDSWEASIKEFSDKHGAVLLGMHHDLQAMQVSIENAENKIAAKVQQLSVKAKKDMLEQQAELATFKNGLDFEIRKLIACQKDDIASQLSQIQIQQKQANTLYEKSLELLSEHKQRDIQLKERELVVLKWMRRIEYSILFGVVLLIVSAWVLFWKQ